MQTEYLIAVDEFCATHNIEISFINSLQQTGLIEITTIQETGFIDADQLQQLEKFIRFYYDLDINMEGIETITHLLQRIQSLQDEIVSLKNTLRFYELNE
ncbi:MAG: chaperone modulator CbpM [Bacteroidales bacterium]|nr:chaperone modulator CbpM [Bacteroidales bacterium]MDD4604063.1 chaperone modulator CbpM [Bacteroidales bacterium]